MTRHHEDEGRRPGPFAAILVLILSIAVLQPLAARAGQIDNPCPLCADDPGVPVVHLTPAMLDSAARAASDFNVAKIARLDSLYRAGRFGDPRSGRARRMVHLMARLATINAYRDLVRLAEDSTRVWEANEDDLRDVLARYSDVSFICGARLIRARFGLGHVCVRYNLDQPGHGEIMQGGFPMQYEVHDTDIDGESRRILDLGLPTASEDIVEVLLSSHFSFDVSHGRSDGPPAPFDYYVVSHLRGAWLRKWGLHHPTAYMYWVTPSDVVDDSLPPDPMVGVRVYIPHLVLRLPWVLPDIDFDDLRDVELPQPILDMDYIHQHRYPEWLDVDEDALDHWVGYGPVPPRFREEFPNF